MIPDKIGDEQGRDKQAEKEKVSPEQIAQLNVGSPSGSVRSNSANADGQQMLGNQSPSYSEFENDKSNLPEVDLEGNASATFLNGTGNQMVREEAKDRYAQNEDD